MDNRIDILNREKFVDDVFNVIKTLSENRKSRTFAINGEWGSGKSFVLDMLEEKLSMWQSEETADDQYIVFHYNCWHYDYYEEPLYAIVTSMYDWIKSNNGKFETYTKNLLLYTLIAFGLTTKEFANGIAEKITMVNFDKVGKETRKTIDSINNKGKLDDELSTVHESIVFTRNLLIEIAKEHTVVVVVDELDRCLPEYAIKVLERLHHLFDDIENLIVVLAVDKEHLNNTVSKIFGFDKENNTKDINSYLAKFIDFEIVLDKGVIDSNYTHKFDEYLSSFVWPDSEYETQIINKLVSSLLQNYSARERDKMFEKALLIHRQVFSGPVDISIMCVELMWIVYSNNGRGKILFNEASFLPRGLEKNLKEFYEFFSINITKSVTINKRTDYFSGQIVEYLLSGNNIGIKEKLLYYTSIHPDYKMSVSIQGIDKDELKNGQAKSLEQFATLLKLIM